MNRGKSGKKYISIPEAAQRIGMTRQGVYRWVKEKRVRGARKMLDTWRVPWPLERLTPNRKEVQKVYGLPDEAGSVTDQPIGGVTS